ncbi:RRP1B protein, partial [Oxylabes madagascariensis]|nr:RRP1B protein [Oxylabes madagascariensis]
MAPAAVQPPEVQFAQRLAANEKRIRDRALKKLRGYIGLRTQRPAGGFSQEELLKIWKGLFYCMWMQDKPLLQEELAANISQLIHVFQNTEARHLFIQTFWQTMNREWSGIDNLRLDKYYMQLNMNILFFFSSLLFFFSLVEPLLQLLMKEIMDPDSNSPTGIKFHFIDIYLDELAKVGAKEVREYFVILFLIDVNCGMKHLRRNPRSISPVSPPFLLPHARRRLLLSYLPLSLASDTSPCNGQSWQQFSIPIPCSQYSNQSCLQVLRFWIVDQEGELCCAFLQQFDYKAVADKIFEFASKKNTPSRNRKRLYKLVKNCNSETVVQADNRENGAPILKEKKKNRVEFSCCKYLCVSHVCYGILFGMDLEDKEELSSVKVPSVPQRKRKKRKKRDSPSADSGTADGNCEEGKAETSGSNASSQEKVPENNKERKRKKLLVNEASETTNVATDTRENHSVCVQNSLTDAEQSKKSQLKKMNPKVQSVPAKPACQNGAATASAAEDVSPSVTPLPPPKAVKKKQKAGAKAGAVLVNGNPPVQQTELKPSKEDLLGTLPRKAGAESAPSRKVTLKTKAKLVGLEGMKVPSQNAATLKKKRKVKEVLISVEGNGVLETVCKKSRKVEGSAALSPLKKKKAKLGNDFVKFEKSTVPKAVFFRKARSAISSPRTSMQLNKLQSPSSKKVTFGLNKNMTAEFKKTDKSILVSPEGASRVAFNPEQKPRHGVLKSPTVTPARESQMKRPFTMSAKKRPTAVDFF